VHRYSLLQGEKSVHVQLPVEEMAGAPETPHQQPIQVAVMGRGTHDGDVSGAAGRDDNAVDGEPWDCVQRQELECCGEDLSADARRV